MTPNPSKGPSRLAVFENDSLNSEYFNYRAKLQAIGQVLSVLISDVNIGLDLSSTFKLARAV